VPKKPVKGPAPSAAEATPPAVVSLSASRLRPNDYNPNRMTAAEFTELVAEVKHLGRLPKPVIVRPNGDGYTIVDGEHGWRAAQEAGLAEVPCEVIDADDFEAMRQTYKRNQHGTHNPVLLGRMFRTMMAGRGLSARALAEEISVSEGTVRNATLYAEAADVRNSYAHAEDEADSRVVELSVRQVRAYLKLGGGVADLWLDSGAVMRLPGTKAADVDANELAYGFEMAVEDLQRLDSTGLFAFVPRTDTFIAFVAAVNKVRDWEAWERHWVRHGIRQEVFRAYAEHFFRGVFYVRDSHMMDNALAEILDIESEPPTFLLTPEEFDAVLSSTGKVESESHTDFMNRLSVAVAEKTGKVRQTSRWVQRQLLERQLEEAPGYIRQSSLPPEAKFVLWKCEGPEQIKWEIARLDYLPRNAMEKGPDSYEACIRRLIGEEQERREIQRQLELRSERDLAGEVARQLGLYEPGKDGGAIEVLTNKLAALTKPELMVLVECCKHTAFMNALAASIRNVVRPSQEPIVVDAEPAP
jgi:ParB/RepB/Spo0J family partition protein